MMKKRRRRQRLPFAFDGEGFRETFLVRFTRRGDASALRRLAFLVVELYIGARPRWWPYHREGDLRAILGAAVLDLRHLRDVLEFAERCETYHREDALLAGFANRCAEEVGGIADSIEEAIEEAIEDPEGALAEGERPLSFLPPLPANPND